MMGMERQGFDQLETAYAAYLQTILDPTQVISTGFLANVREGVVGFLHGQQVSGRLPQDVDIRRTRVTQNAADPNRVDVHLPVKLLLYLTNGSEHSVSTARFEHHCPSCRFLGHGHGCDLYRCAQSRGMVPTVVARHSSKPSDYESGLLVARAQDTTEPLGLALALAREAGLQT